MPTKKVTKKKSSPKTPPLKKPAAAKAAGKTARPAKPRQVAAATKPSAKIRKGTPIPAAEPGVRSGARLSFRGRLQSLAGHRLFDKVFATASLAILVLTTCYWAILSASLHEVNADQFIDAYMFESVGTFREALFPGAHTFLIKWPLFAVMALYGQSWIVFTGMTVLMTLATVGALAYMLYKIERRPLLFGLICLGLASVLLLIPAQPHPGALLPANFAMTTTRNLEYIVFIACMYAVLRASGYRHKYFWIAAGLLALLVASDKLFAVLALGGVLFLLVVYAGLLRRRYDRALGIRALAMTILGSAAANTLLLAIVFLGITHVVNETSASPFSLISSAGQLAQGLLYGAAAILTNFGANPVHEVLVIREIPSALLASLMRPSIIGYAVNAALLAFAFYAACRTLRSHTTGAATQLTVILCGATLAALAVFVLTDHYYPVDSRYLAIELFALTLAAALQPRYCWLACNLACLAPGRNTPAAKPRQPPIRPCMPRPPRRSTEITYNNCWVIIGR
jgi:hypothetical protein